MRGVEVVEDLVGGGGDAVFLHQSLGKDLAALDLGGGLARGRRQGTPMCLKGVGHAEAERDRPGVTTAKSARDLPGEVHGAVYVRGGHGHADRVRGDAAVAGQGVDLRRLRVAPERPDDGVLSPAAANDHYLHKKPPN